MAKFSASHFKSQIRQAQRKAERQLKNELNQASRKIERDINKEIPQIASVSWTPAR